MKRRDAPSQGPRGRFFLGLFLLTFATLMLELVETRLLSVMRWYHLAFFVISAAMFGMTAGAVWVYAKRSRFTQATLSADLAWMTAAFAVSVPVALLVQASLAPAFVASATFVAVYAELAVAIALPFFFSGAAVSLALTRSPFPAGRVYAVDLAGAALGCLGVLVLLRLTDASSAILLIGAVVAASAALLAGSGIGGPAPSPPPLARLLGRPWTICVVLLALGLVNGLTRRGLQPLMIKERIEPRGEGMIFEKWNSFSRVIAMRPVIERPRLWGPSPTLPPIRVPQIWLNIDGDAGTVMSRFDGNPESARYLSYDVTNLVYALGSSRRTAVIGVGGGRDVLSAWCFGSRDVTGVELNPTFLDLLLRKEPFATFAGIRALPGVRLINDEARSWFTRSRESFGVIQMSMADTWAATGAGAFTLTENGLYTVEGWRAFLARLAPDGLFTVSRWYEPDDVDETGRLVSLAVAALLDAGVTEPRAHLFIATSGPVATLILSRAPFKAEDIATLRGFCGTFQFNVHLSPDAAPPSPLIAAMVACRDRAELQRRTSGLDLDLTPPDDERPFFFNLLPLDQPLRAIRYIGRGGVVGGNLLATTSLCTIMLVSLILIVATIVLPLRGAIREAGRGVVIGGTLYFAMLGLGFMLVEMGLLQRLSLFLGHPVYSLSIVLFSLILAAGAGSWLSERMRLASPAVLAAWAVVLAGYVASLPAWMPGLLAPFQSAGIAARAGVCLALIAPAGLLMGFGFPTGLRLAAARDERPTVWFWGINGAAGVLGSAIAIALSIAFGIGTTLILGAVCYLALIPAAAIIGFTPRAPRAR